MDIFKAGGPHFRGKVRDVYYWSETWCVLIASDRISAFDHLFDVEIPHKGQVLTELTAFFLLDQAPPVPHWLCDVLYGRVSVGVRCRPIPLEIIVRGYLEGSAWRKYRRGVRRFDEVILPDGLRLHDRLPHPIITITTKAHEGHDVDVDSSQITAEDIVDAETLFRIKQYALALYEWGSTLSESKGLILVDTKYEFGWLDGELCLMDEVHTPDSSRYFIREEYEYHHARGEDVPHYSKEFFRQWLIAQGFMGEEGQLPPLLPQWLIDEVSRRYLMVYEMLTGRPLSPATPPDTETLTASIEQCIKQCHHEPKNTVGRSVGR